MSCARLESKIVRDLLKSVDNFFFDCDGVLWKAGIAIPGSKELLRKLKKLGKNIFFLTNNSAKSRKFYADQGQQMGFPITEADIMTTGYAAPKYLQTIGFKGKVYLVGNSGMEASLTELGIPSIGLGPDPVKGVLADWLKMKLDPEVKCVMVGFDQDINYMKVLKAASYARSPGCLFLATNEDNCLPNDTNIVIPGTGTIVAPIKLALGREPLIIGKPSRIMIDMLVSSFNLDLHRSLMVGDRLDTDIAMATHCGIRSLFVLTGHSDLDEVNSCINDPSGSKSHCIPTYHTDSVQSFHDLLLTV